MKEMAAARRKGHSVSVSVLRTTWRERKLSGGQKGKSLTLRLGYSVSVGCSALSPKKDAPGT